MHYYQFNIGDYASHTKGLSLLEDLAYRRLIDEYYLAERPFNGCSTTVARIIGFVERVDAVEYVLNRFFENVDGEWVHRRIENDLKTFKKRKESARKAGKASAKSRGKSKTKNDRSEIVEQKVNSRSTDVQQSSTNQEPITNNQEPITNNQVSGGGGAAFAKSQRHSLASLEKFYMTPDWQPDPTEWETHAVSLGVKPDQTRGDFFNQCLAGYRLHHANEGQAHNQGKWHLKLANWIKSESAKLGEQTNVTGSTPEGRQKIYEKYGGL